MLRCIPGRPPCDGACALLKRPKDAYLGTFFSYVQVRPHGSSHHDPHRSGHRLEAASDAAMCAPVRQLPTVGGGSWKFVASDGQEIGYTPELHDSVFFHWKTAGYSHTMLPKLVPCPLGEGEAERLLVLSSWLPAKGAPVKKDEL
jgi:hypothetical protein